MNKATIATLLMLALGSVPAVRAADAAETWEKTCVKCHGADGKGETKLGKKAEVKDFTDAKYQDSFTDEKAFKAIKEGIKDGDKTKMKPAEDINDAAIKDLIKKVRGFKK